VNVYIRAYRKHSVKVSNRIIHVYDRSVAQVYVNYCMSTVVRIDNTLQNLVTEFSRYVYRIAQVYLLQCISTVELINNPLYKTDLTRYNTVV
jgi:hypothetical protein